jgi:hypothetical protein
MDTRVNKPENMLPAIALAGFLTTSFVGLDTTRALLHRSEHHSHPPRLERRAGHGCFTEESHSLRAGLATAAASAGVQEGVIAQTTGHKSMKVLRRYIRVGNLFNENAAAAVGL